MKILPAMDLIDGKCVRLYQGDFNKTTQVGSDPASQLQTFMNDGAEIIHIVDLDGARSGKPEQFELISELCAKSTVPIQVGGGIRNLETVEAYVNSGVDRIVIGTAAIQDREFLQAALEKHRKHIVIGIDARNEKVAVSGWEQETEMDYIEFAKQMEQLGVQTIVFTDISKDGTMQGPNLEQLKKINDAVSCKIVASGGIRNQEDLDAVAALGIEEAIVGKAMYEGTVKLRRS
ncbi:1-(5-phosphoribosyl)-5-[(5-phosphoribosylamino)methylideneamino]imidazole-4-carboxamide isomerase [Siminovitchia sp. FSL H7-0308]|uniref:1-(5-phosphoribosyl)-5-[(5-phosphoribosylamino)methylideneamino] imidazole-4-carboxamide isomerase n=1 Tax=Siminovitchia thermophila TaxID=1245522 RepID=A0ABS2R127_9BACI|nr:1-(5-phosphoribosyl)-5-[(5-phosphoribosylamino)methylideneamino]imidazole-4-carboxamide isomerase [Siminovitchia thermophila]MBM7713070.1 phosphoribosylformimino-5-aminoimidazole carboxamide ribotide isomerase [Siminovitchia thermophila]ONK24890.1 1-(5-phosphoribosyl)-5-[(5-phosphoribosylamino)methylideneamino]imidazole-4-carboxamide isomerase [Bacillus sp. VT-16-64]